jgi:hypothetical protein
MSENLTRHVHADRNSAWDSDDKEDLYKEPLKLPEDYLAFLSTVGNSEYNG